MSCLMPVMFLYASICSSGKDSVGVGLMTVVRSGVLLEPYGIVEDPCLFVWLINHG